MRAPSTILRRGLPVILALLALAAPWPSVAQPADPTCDPAQQDALGTLWGDLRALFDAPAEFRSAVEGMAADGAVDAAEWSAFLEQWGPQLPIGASPEGRSLVAFYLDPALRIEAATREEIAAVIEWLGYPVVQDEDAPPAEGTTTLLGIFAASVAETDRDFEWIRNVSGAGTANAVVAVFEPRVAPEIGSHPHLAERLWTNPGEIPGNGIDDDGNGHVDDVHGLIDHSAPGFHASHVSGIATRGSASIDALLITTDKDAALVREKIEYAIAHGARVINMSFSWHDSTPMVDVIRSFPQVLFVKSAGNDGLDLRTLPVDDDGRPVAAPDARLDHVLTRSRLPNFLVVASGDPHGAPAAHSNYGAPFVDVAAPGEEILSTGRTDAPAPLGDHPVTDPRAQGFIRATGTSMATPFVTNVAAKCLQLDPTLDPVSLKHLLAATSWQSATWEGVVAAGGMVDPGLAYRAAAMRAMLARGESFDAAADRLALDASQREAIGAVLQSMRRRS